MAPHSSTLCLENPMDGGAWWAAVYGVTQSWTRLKQLSSSKTPKSLSFPLVHHVYGCCDQLTRPLLEGTSVRTRTRTTSVSWDPAFFFFFFFFWRSGVCCLNFQTLDGTLGPCKV